MLAEFARQIDEEKKAKERETHAKAAAYQQMLKDNAKELERKKAIKEAERQENQRLFEMQIEMAEKQVCGGWWDVLCLQRDLDSKAWSFLADFNNTCAGAHASAARRGATTAAEES